MLLFLLFVREFQNIHVLCIDWVELLGISDNFGVGSRDNLSKFAEVFHAH